MLTFFHDPFKIKISKSPNTQTQKYKDKCVNESIVLKISLLMSQQNCKKLGIHNYQRAYLIHSLGTLLQL